MIDTILSIASVTTTVTLAAGLLLWGLGQDSRSADLVIDTGLVVLMAMPVARLLDTLIREIRERDWRFAALGVIVLLLLGSSVAIAFL